jgi:hypothetical protein
MSVDDGDDSASLSLSLPRDRSGASSSRGSVELASRSHDEQADAEGSGSSASDEFPLHDSTLTYKPPVRRKVSELQGMYSVVCMSVVQHALDYIYVFYLSFHTTARLSTSASSTNPFDLIDEAGDVAHPHARHSPSSSLRQRGARGGRSLKSGSQPPFSLVVAEAVARSKRAGGGSHLGAAKAASQKQHSLDQQLVHEEFNKMLAAHARQADLKMQVLKEDTRKMVTELHQENAKLKKTLAFFVEEHVKMKKTHEHRFAGHKRDFEQLHKTQNKHFRTLYRHQEHVQAEMGGKPVGVGGLSGGSTFSDLWSVLLQWFLIGLMTLYEPFSACVRALGGRGKSKEVPRKPRWLLRAQNTLLEQQQHQQQPSTSPSEGDLGLDIH